MGACFALNDAFIGTLLVHSICALRRCMASITKRGPLQYRALVRRIGFPSYSRTFDHRADAVRWATSIEAAIGRRDLAEVRRLGEFSSDPDAMTTIGDLVDKYITQILPNRRNPGNEKPRLNRIRDALGRVALSMITTTDIVRFRDQRVQEGASPQTVRHDLNTVSKLLGHAISEWGVQVINVARDVQKPRLPRGRDRRLSEQELKYLLLAARTAPKQPRPTKGRPPLPAPPFGLAPLITLAVETSMRQGELVALKWRDVDLQSSTAHVREAKNGESRTVALSSQACAALKDLSKRHSKARKVARSSRKSAAPKDLTTRSSNSDSKVFEWADPHSVARPFRTAVARAQALYRADCAARGENPDENFLVDVRFHDLRHEATSRLFEKGLNPFEVASMTGHKSMQMLKRYTHVQASRLAAKLG